MMGISMPEGLEGLRTLVRPLIGALLDTIDVLLKMAGSTQDRKWAILVVIFVFLELLLTLMCFFSLCVDLWRGGGSDPRVVLLIWVVMSAVTFLGTLWGMDRVVGRADGRGLEDQYADQRQRFGF